MAASSIKKIIVPMDLSRCALAAWRLAGRLSGPLGAEVEAVAFDELPYPSAKDEREGRAGIAAMLRRRLGPGARLRVIGGDPAASLLRLAQKERPGLIVMGTHGRRGLARAFLGSVAERVVRRSPVPVITVRARG